MFKKIALTVSLYLAIICTSYANFIPVNAISADDISASEKDFNDQVMNIMKDIEAKSNIEKNINDYLNHVKASNHIKQAVKSSILNHIKYSDYHKVAPGIYFCNDTYKGGDKKDSICQGSSSGKYHCIYRAGAVCYTGNCHN